MCLPAGTVRVEALESLLRRGIGKVGSKRTGKGLPKIASFFLSKCSWHDMCMYKGECRPHPEPRFIKAYVVEGLRHWQRN